MKVLILVLSADFPPYDQMIQTSISTWDSIKQDECETIYYCGLSKKPNTDNIIYLPVKESYGSMGHKTIQALELALNNKEFDYIARVNSSCYVRKKQLMDYVNELPKDNVFSGLVVKDKKDWVWGGGHYVISKDVVQRIVKNKGNWNHSEIEDKAMSYLVSEIGVPFMDGNACSINKKENDWSCLAYGFTESFNFDTFEDLEKLDKQYFIRVKQDGERQTDEVIMRGIFAFDTKAES